VDAPGERPLGFGDLANGPRSQRMRILWPSDDGSSDECVLALGRALILTVIVLFVDDVGHDWGTRILTFAYAFGMFALPTLFPSVHCLRRMSPPGNS
jgi:hypothetical protein